MSIEDRQRWNERHRHRAALKPRGSVLSLPRASRTDARALDLACGQGRHIAALVEAGYRVVAMDVAMPALRHARAALAEDTAARAGVVQADIESWPFAPAAFDLVVQIDFLERKIFPELRKSLRPGGLLLIDTFLDQGKKNAEGPSRTEYLLAPSELPEAFAEFDLLGYEEVRGETARGVFLGRKR